MNAVQSAERETLRLYAEYGPRNSPMNPELQGWTTPSGLFVCGKCAARILGRGCQLPRGSEPVWKNQPTPENPCAVC